MDKIINWELPEKADWVYATLYYNQKKIFIQTYTVIKYNTTMQYQTIK